MSGEIQIDPQNLSIASFWMLRPDYVGLRNQLEELGYTVKSSEINSTPDTLALKGTIEVFSDAQRRTLGVRGRTSSHDLVEAYKELMHINLEILGVDSINIMFHELIANYSIISKKNPMEILTKFKIENQLLEKFGKILELDVKNLGFRITTEDSVPTSSKWVSIIIEPFYVSSTKRYSARVVFRDTFDPVIEFSEIIEERLEKIIKEIEG